MDLVEVNLWQGCMCIESFRNSFTFTSGTGDFERGVKHGEAKGNAPVVPGGHVLWALWRLGVNLMRVRSMHVRYTAWCIPHRPPWFGALAIHNILVVGICSLTGVLVL